VTPALLLLLVNLLLLLLLLLRGRQRQGVEGGCLLLALTFAACWLNPGSAALRTHPPACGSLQHSTA
jgi:hypothetical protein